MTVRKFKPTDVKNRKEIKAEVETPRDKKFISHEIEFVNGAVVAYEDEAMNGFVWVKEADI